MYDSVGSFTHRHTHTSMDAEQRCCYTYYLHALWSVFFLHIYISFESLHIQRHLKHNLSHWRKINHILTDCLVFVECITDFIEHSCKFYLITCWLLFIIIVVERIIGMIGLDLEWFFICFRTTFNTTSWQPAPISFGATSAPPILLSSNWPLVYSIEPFIWALNASITHAWIFQSPWPFTKRTYGFNNSDNNSIGNTATCHLSVDWIILYC